MSLFRIGVGWSRVGSVVCSRKLNWECCAGRRFSTVKHTYFSRAGVKKGILWTIGIIPLGYLTWSIYPSMEVHASKGRKASHSACSVRIQGVREGIVMNFYLERRSEVSQIDISGEAVLEIFFRWIRWAVVHDTTGFLGICCRSWPAA